MLVFGVWTQSDTGLCRDFRVHLIVAITWYVWIVLLPFVFNIHPALRQHTQSHLDSGWCHVFPLSQTCWHSSYPPITHHFWRCSLGLNVLTQLIWKKRAGPLALVSHSSSPLCVASRGLVLLFSIYYVIFLCFSFFLFVCLKVVICKKLIFGSRSQLV